MHNKWTFSYVDIYALQYPIACRYSHILTNMKLLSMNCRIHVLLAGTFLVLWKICTFFSHLIPWYENILKKSSNIYIFTFFIETSHFHFCTFFSHLIPWYENVFSKKFKYLLFWLFLLKHPTFIFAHNKHDKCGIRKCFCH